MIKFKSFSFHTSKNLFLPSIAQREATLQLLSTSPSSFPFLNYVLKFFKSKAKIILAATHCFLPLGLVSLAGLPAAEVCCNNHLPTVCSLAMSPALCMGLFMFLSTDNYLKERSVSSMGMRQCETVCRSWVRDSTHRQDKLRRENHHPRTGKSCNNMWEMQQNVLLPVRVCLFGL